jgi:hypothetical protein
MVGWLPLIGSGVTTDFTSTYVDLHAIKKIKVEER